MTKNTRIRCESQGRIENIETTLVALSTKTQLTYPFFFLQIREISTGYKVNKYEAEKSTKLIK